MQRCAYCGIDTALWVNGVPMCLVCSDAKDPDKAKANNLSFPSGPPFVSASNAQLPKERHQTSPPQALSNRKQDAMSKQSVKRDLALRRQIDILVVESNPAETFLTSEAFKAAGLTSGFTSVSSGEDALSYVHKQGAYADAKTPDVIFLDLSLPGVTGLEVLKAIKTTPHLMHIPVVVASGTEDPEHIRAVYALNGNCFMRKPNDLTQFLKFVKTCFEFWGNIVTLSPPPPIRDGESGTEGFKEELRQKSLPGSSKAQLQQAALELKDKAKFSAITWQDIEAAVEEILKGALPNRQEI
jgi:CheY-like chemotaxis protein